MATLGTQQVVSGHVSIFERGDCYGEIQTDSSEPLTVGSRVDLVIGTLTISCAIVRGDVSQNSGRYQVAGRPEWDRLIPSRGSAGYHSATGQVLLKTVLSDINRDALGSSWASLVSMPDASRLNAHFERPGTNGETEVRARDLLELLELPWYVRNDGMTVFAARPSGAVTTASRIDVEHRNLALGWRTIRCEDPAAFMPGLTFENEVIGRTVFVMKDSQTWIHTWARAASDAPTNWIKAVVRRVFPRLFFQGVHTFVTVGASSSGKHDLKSLGSRWLPDVKLCDSWPGVAGVNYELQPGTKVLLAFADSDPAKPVVVAVEPSAVPVSSSLESTTSMDIDSAEVNLGAASAPVLRSGDLVTLIGAITLVGPNAVKIQLSPFDPMAPPLPVLPPTKVKA